MVLFVADGEPARDDLLDGVFSDREVGRADLRGEKGADLGDC